MKHYEDLSGRTFGMLTVLRRGASQYWQQGTFWVCRCACGKLTHPFWKQDLLRGRNISCGCQLGKHIIDMTGKVVGILTVIERSYDHPRAKKESCWKCVCFCGSVVSRSGSYLRVTGSALRSCGCARRKQPMPPIQQPKTYKPANILVSSSDPYEHPNAEWYGTRPHDYDGPYTPKKHS